jgi:hypothetical protein
MSQYHSVDYTNGRAFHLMQKAGVPLRMIAEISGREEEEVARLIDLAISESKPNQPRGRLRA